MYLNCHTCYSLKYGTLFPETLFEEAMKNGVRKLILTDINNTGAWIEFAGICHKRREEYTLEYSVGLEFRNLNQFKFICIAKNNRGFEQINRFFSDHQPKKKAFPDLAPQWNDVFTIYSAKKTYPEVLSENEFIGVSILDANKIGNNHLFKDKLVILQPVTVRDRRDFNIHRLLRAIDSNTILSKLSPDDTCHDTEKMIPISEIQKHFKNHPKIISNTQHILDNVYFEAQLGESKNRKYFIGDGLDTVRLRRLAVKGLLRRYDQPSKYIIERFNRELKVIADLGFEGYFLITWDFIRFAKSQGFEHVGRGSGANSLVAYCLAISEVDPIELDLYFERFLNPHRTSPPDFDIDFSWKDRNTVIQYIFDKYGYEHVSLLASYSTFQGKSTIRELAKVFGLPKVEIDLLVNYPERYGTKDEISRLILKYAQFLKGFPANLSIHAGGILISEGPIHAFTATSYPPKGFPVTHFDMFPAEDVGYYKFDVLSQRGLGHIKDTIQIVRQNKGEKVNIKQFKKFKDDPLIKAAISSGKAMGCFYIESPAMRMLLAKLECKTYETLVAASSIIRPGVASSGMMREYIYRHHHPDEITYMHPQMKELMQETFGVMVYQEDVLKVAHHFAGLDLGEADMLRRAMSGKYRSKAEFKKVEDSFFRSCKQKGHSDTIANELWRQIESFSGYSFSKAHSASFAVESYESLYLKVYYPLEFMVGVINNFGGFYKTEFYFHEARMAGAKIQAPCVNEACYLTTIRGDTIFVGFIHIKYLDASIGELIEQERNVNGFYTCLEDFVRRLPLGLEKMIILIRIGAFRFTNKSKGALLWEVQSYFGQQKKLSRDKELFHIETKQWKLPELQKRPYEDAFDEIELLEFPLCHPFDLLPETDMESVNAKDLKNRNNDIVEVVGYLVNIKTTRSKNFELMNFGTFIDKEGNYFDTIHFPGIAKRYPFLGKGFYYIKGKVQLDFNYPIIEVLRMVKRSMVQSGGGG